MQIAEQRGTGKKKCRFYTMGLLIKKIPTGKEDQAAEDDEKGVAKKDNEEEEDSKKPTGKTKDEEGEEGEGDDGNDDASILELLEQAEMDQDSLLQADGGILPEDEFALIEEQDLMQDLSLKDAEQLLKTAQKMTANAVAMGAAARTELKTMKKEALLRLQKKLRRRARLAKKMADQKAALQGGVGGGAGGDEGKKDDGDNPGDEKDFGMRNFCRYGRPLPPFPLFSSAVFHFTAMSAKKARNVQATLQGQASKKVLIKHLLASLELYKNDFPGSAGGGGGGKKGSKKSALLENHSAAAVVLDAEPASLLDPDLREGNEELPHESEAELSASFRELSSALEVRKDPKPGSVYATVFAALQHPFSSKVAKPTAAGVPVETGLIVGPYCEPHCYCPNGIFAEYPLCSHPGIACQDCNDGFEMRTIKVFGPGADKIAPQKACEPLKCQCENGAGVTGKGCKKDGDIACAACDPGYSMSESPTFGEGPICTLNICICPGGIALKGLACPCAAVDKCFGCADGLMRIGEGVTNATCNAGYHMGGVRAKRCRKNSCFCEGGVLDSEAGCPKPGLQMCKKKSCNLGFHDEESEDGKGRVCVLNKCSCGRHAGMGTVGPECPVDNGEQCAVCLPGWSGPHKAGSKKICRARCSCRGGVAVGDTYPAAGYEDHCPKPMERCESCLEGYVLMGDPKQDGSPMVCVPQCSCENGVPAAGQDCFVPAKACTGCKPGYRLYNRQCLPKCKCKGGIAAVGKACWDGNGPIRIF